MIALPSSYGLGSSQLGMLFNKHLCLNKQISLSLLLLLFHVLYIFFLLGLGINYFVGQG